MTMASPPWIPGFVLKAIADLHTARGQALAVILPQVHRFDELLALPPQIKVPTLLIWDKADGLIDANVVPGWKAVLAQASVVILDGVGHMPMVGQPKQTASQYQQFPHTLKRAL